MFLKVFTISHIQAWAGQLVLIGDGILLAVLLQTGVSPQFARQADADVCMLAFLFACVSIAHGIQMYNSMTSSIDLNVQQVTPKKGL